MDSGGNSGKRRRGNGDEFNRQIKRWKPNFLVDEDFIERLKNMLLCMLGRLIQEVIPEIVRRFVQPAPRVVNNVENNSRYQLEFLNSIGDVIYSNTEVTSEDGKPVKIAIVDINMINSRQPTAIPFPLRSCIVELFVLHGDAQDADNESWVKNSGQEHNSDLVHKRKGKAPLLKGKDVVTLENGVGLLKISFTDNSKFARKQKFRIGLKYKPTRNTQLRVRSAISKPFKVKELRGRVLKNIPPRLNDEVWHLEKIAKGKDLYNRLIEAKIVTVQQFLQQLAIDHEKLRKILGKGKLKSPGFNEKTWKAILRSAENCDPGNEVYYYTIGGDQGVVLIFNSIYQLLQVKFDGCFYATDNLGQFDEALVRSWKEKALANTSEFKLMDGTFSQEPQANVISVQPSCSFDQNAAHIISGGNRTEALYNDDSYHLPVLEPELHFELNNNIDPFTNGQMNLLSYPTRDWTVDTFINSSPQLNVTSVQQSVSFDSIHGFSQDCTHIVQLDETIGEVLLPYQQHPELSATLGQPEACSSMWELHTVHQFSSHQETHNSFNQNVTTVIGSDPSSSQQSQYIDGITNLDSPVRLDLLAFDDDESAKHIVHPYQQSPEENRSSPVIRAYLNGENRPFTAKNWAMLKISLQVVAFFRAQMEARKDCSAPIDLTSNTATDAGLVIA